MRPGCNFGPPTLDRADWVWRIPARAARPSLKKGKQAPQGGDNDFGCSISPKRLPPESVGARGVSRPLTLDPAALTSFLRRLLSLWPPASLERRRVIMA